ncbi:MAG: hypothetical protein KJ882_05050, partial [Proteobacteria bacterium]|nr:hypothetical protein [Pseudomonadota bacterium]
MIADIDSGTVLNTITLKRGAKGVAIDTGKSISITSGLKELNLFDISSGSIISNIKDGDDFLTGIKLKGITDYLAGGGNDYINDSDINTDITSFLNLYNSEIDETIIGDLENAGSGLSYFQNDSTYGLDINPSTHIAVITGEESLLLLDLNTNTLNEYPITDINSLRSVAVDKYRNISLVSYLKDTAGDQPERGVLEVQLPNPVPRITEITPSGAAAGDTDVKLRIDGEGFIASSSVKFNRFDINTAFSGNNTLDAIVPSTFLSSAGIFPVTVTNPLPSGGVSDSFTFTVQNPVPLISTIDPPQAIAGTLGLAVNISGKGFINDTAIYVNGIQRTYTPISSTELKLSLVPADLQTGGHIEITASNPKPGGGISGNVTFMVLNSDSSAKSSDIITSLNTNLDLDEISKLDEKLPLAQNIPPLSDLGFDYDEQQGGGGLVGETIRVLNGNVLEYRNDLQFSS